TRPQLERCRGPRARGRERRCRHPWTHSSASGLRDAPSPLGRERARRANVTASREGGPTFPLTTPPCPIERTAVSSSGRDGPFLPRGTDAPWGLVLADERTLEGTMGVSPSGSEK